MWPPFLVFLVSVGDNLLVSLRLEERASKPDDAMYYSKHGLIMVSLSEINKEGNKKITFQVSKGQNLLNFRVKNSKESVAKPISNLDCSVKRFLEDFCFTHYILQSLVIVLLCSFRLHLLSSRIKRMNAE